VSTSACQAVSPTIGMDADLDMVQAIRLRDEGPGRTDDVLGVRAMPLREGQQAEHLVTGLVEGDARADRLHGARDVPAEHERGLADNRSCLPLRPVDRIDARRVHTDQDLAHAGLGPGDGDELEDFRSAELVLADGLHRVVMSSML
jgi:hypothetical protein